MTEAPSDRQEIIDLAVAYCWALDTGDYEVLRSVFTADATAQLGSSSQSGVEEIIERVSTSLAKFVGSQHMVSTHQVVTDGDTATARCFLQAQHMRREGEAAPLYTVGGRYEDRLVRTASGWRIAHRDLMVMWRDG